MPEESRFVTNFKKVFGEKTFAIDPKAKEVIDAVALYGKSAMVGEKVINYFFADHGWNHSTRMSESAVFMLDHLKKEQLEKFDDITWNNMIVLLWTAIALHDIGMNDISKEDKELGETIICQNGRNDHVKKSGEWLSRLVDLCEGKRVEEGIGDKQKAQKFIDSWIRYWEDERQIDTVTALRIVKDIVLMHGESTNWLMPQRIGALDRDIISSDIDESERDIYRKIIKYDEGILCLCDLIDICPERMDTFGNDTLNMHFNGMQIEKKVKTFEHWVSHNITTVSKEYYEQNGMIRLNMISYNRDSNMYLKNVLNSIYPNFGAIKACLEWGNKQQLFDILIDFGFKGIEVHLSRSKVETWNNIHEMAKKLFLFQDSIMLDINNVIGGTTNTYVNDIMCCWVNNSWDIKEDKNLYQKVRSIYHLFGKGACLHLLYDVVSANNQFRGAGYYVDIQDEQELDYDISDRLLMAVNAFFLICKNQREINNVEIFSKGSNKFSALYGGADAQRNTAYIIFIDSYHEDDLSRIVDTVKKSKDSFVIFVNTKENSSYKEDSNCQEIKYKINKKKFEDIRPILNNYAIEHWGSKDKASYKEEEQVKELDKKDNIGVGIYLKELKTIYNGIQAIRDTIVADLEKDQYSTFFIINLFEMMSESIEKKRAVKKDELQWFYNEFYNKKRNDMLKMDPFQDAIQILLKLCEEDNGKIELLEKYSDSFDSLIIDSSKELKNNIKRDLFQKMIFFWLYNFRKVNFKSICYKEYLTFLSPEQLCCYILNSNIALIERINISLETSEIIVDGLQQNKGNETLKMFTEQYLIALLNNRSCLYENEDIICFQTVYRIFRGILEPEMQEEIKGVLEVLKSIDSAVGYLGFVEGVCSAKLAGEEDFYTFIDGFLKDFLKKIFSQTESTVQYMAYDILYNYNKGDVRKRYYREDWENICASLHGRENIKEENEGKVYREWDAMRKKFMYILKNTSDSIKRRNMFDNDTEKEVTIQ